MGTRHAQTQPVFLIEPVERRLHLHAGHGFHASINFQPAGAPVMEAFLADTGATFGLRDNGLVYGWDANNTANARQRFSSTSIDAAYDTFNHLQRNGSRKWELSLPNGRYDVRIVSGDAGYIDSVYKINVEGVLVVNGTPTSGSRWVEGSRVVTVTDGRLTVSNASGSANNKINFIHVSLDEDTPNPPEPPPPTSAGWSAIAPLPLARTEAMSISRNGQLYVFGGFFDGRWDATKRVDVYNIAADSWTRLPDMPVAITHSATVLHGENVILVGGYVGDSPGPATRDVWNFNTRTHSWSKLPSLPDARGSGGAGVVDSQLYFFGGAKRLSTNSVETDHSNTWSLDLNNTAAGWKSRASMPTPRNHLGYATLDDKIYSIGGQLRDRESSGNQTAVHVFDASRNQWSSRASLPLPLGHIHAVVDPATRSIVIAGGVTNGFSNTDRIHLYNPSQNRWTVAGKLPAPRKSVNLAIHDAELVITGGGNNVALATGFKTAWGSLPPRALPASEASEHLLSHAALMEVLQ